jgi:hypothetical protein
MKRILVILVLLFSFSGICLADEDQNIAIEMYEKAKATKNPNLACEYCEKAIRHAQYALSKNYNLMGQIIDSCRKIIIDSQDKALDDLDKTERAISQGKIFVGMSKNDLLRSWGAPLEKNIGNYGGNIHEQWVYGDFGPYVYLEGDIVTSIQYSEKGEKYRPSGKIGR